MLSSMVRLGPIMSSTINVPQGKFRCRFAGGWNDSVFLANHDKQLNYDRDLISMFCLAGSTLQ